MGTKLLRIEDSLNHQIQIVVGGGAAGLAVARRLSDDISKNVLVLEAGRSAVNEYVPHVYLLGICSKNLACAALS